MAVAAMAGVVLSCSSTLDDSMTQSCHLSEQQTAQAAWHPSKHGQQCAKKGQLVMQLGGVRDGESAEVNSWADTIRHGPRDVRQARGMRASDNNKRAGGDVWAGATLQRQQSGEIGVGTAGDGGEEAL